MMTTGKHITGMTQLLKRAYRILPVLLLLLGSMRPVFAACTCGFDDGLFTQTTITTDGDMSDWATVIADSDNVACDEVGPTDRDHKVQSTGRDLITFVFTWDSTNAYAYTERAASKSNIQKFIYYLDGNDDGLMETGEPVIAARWSGSNRTVSVFLGTYVAVAPGGDPMEDGAGFADGYGMPGTLAGLPSPGNPDYSGTWGSASGTIMEWAVPWSALGIDPDTAKRWHVSSTNSEPQAPSLPAQIDDNLGGCGGCTGSTQFSDITFIPDNAVDVLPSVTAYLPHSLTNNGNGTETFNLTSSVTGAITPTSIDYYEDLGTIGQYDPGIDVLLTDTNSDTTPDTGLIIGGGSINLLVATGMPGAPLGLSAQVVTTATSSYLPSCSNAPPVSKSVTDTLTGGTQISGTVFSDTSHDGIEDGGEAGIPGVTMVLYNTGTTSCVSTQTNASGNYSFSGVADGNYRIIEAAAETFPAPAACPPAEQDPAGFLSTTDNTLNITVAGSSLGNNDFGDFNGNRIEGTVFEDNGTGSGTAHDGNINGAENGLTGVAVEANNGVTLDSTTTNANGQFILWVADAASGANVDILTATPGSYISTSKSDGGAGDSSAATALDQISLVPVSGQVYSGLAFGDVREPAFAPDHSRSASPGSTLFYAHIFTAYTSGTVSFSTAGLIATPNVPGWNAVLYDDSNCNGTLEQGEPLHSAPISMDADTTSQVCLIAQVFVPASAPENAQYLVTLAATFSYNATSLSTIRNRTDLTTVGDSSLVLVKVVDIPTAQPGELLTYTITYTNAGSDALSTIVIDDKTPAFTTFSSASCVLPLPANLTGCLTGTAPAVGGTGAIQWTFNSGDTLQSGSSGQVQYQVTVDN